MAALIGVYCGLQNSWKPQAVLEVHFDAAARRPDFGGTPQAVLEVHFDASLLGYPCAWGGSRARFPPGALKHAVADAQRPDIHT